MIEKIDTADMQNRNGHDLWFQQAINKHHFYYFNTAL